MLMSAMMVLASFVSSSTLGTREVPFVAFRCCVQAMLMLSTPLSLEAFASALCMPGSVGRGLSRLSEFQWAVTGQVFFVSMVDSRVKPCCYIAGRDCVMFTGLPGFVSKRVSCLVASSRGTEHQKSL